MAVPEEVAKRESFGYDSLRTTIRGTSHLQSHEIIMNSRDQSSESLHD